MSRSVSLLFRIAIDAQIGIAVVRIAAVIVRLATLLFGSEMLIGSCPRSAPKSRVLAIHGGKGDRRLATSRPVTTQHDSKFVVTRNGMHRSAEQNAGQRGTECIAARNGIHRSAERNESQRGTELI